MKRIFGKKIKFAMDILEKSDINKAEVLFIGFRIYTFLGYSQENSIA
jgi:hypothetical protein